MRLSRISNGIIYLTTGAKRNLTGPTMGTDRALICLDVPGETAFSQKFKFLGSGVGVNNCISTIATAKRVRSLNLVSAAIPISAETLRLE